MERALESTYPLLDNEMMNEEVQRRRRSCVTAIYDQIEPLAACLSSFGLVDIGDESLHGGS